MIEFEHISKRSWGWFKDSAEGAWGNDLFKDGWPMYDYSNFWLVTDDDMVMGYIGLEYCDMGAYLHASRMKCCSINKAATALKAFLDSGNLEDGFIMIETKTRKGMPRLLERFGFELFREIEYTDTQLFRRL